MCSSPVSNRIRAKLRRRFLLNSPTPARSSTPMLPQAHRDAKALIPPLVLALGALLLALITPQAAQPSSKSHAPNPPKSRPPSSNPGSKGFERLQLFGKTYLDASEWARANGCSARWLKPKEEFLISNDRLRLQLNVDGKRALLNGVQVWFSSPIVPHNGGVCFSEVDLQTLIHPILFPNRRERAAKTIVLDAGHGGKDRGKVAGPYEEKSLTLALAKELRGLLEKQGFHVALTRTDDTTTERDDRADIAREKGGDLFISLHFNSAGEAGPSIRGVEVYCMTPAGENSTNGTSDPSERQYAPGNRFDAQNALLGYEIQRAITRRLNMEDRGLRRARFAVLRVAHMPSVLVEGGFLSSPAEARLVANPAHRRKLAEAIAAGLKAYLEHTEPKPSANPKEPKSTKAKPRAKQTPSHPPSKP